MSNEERNTYVMNQITEAAIRLLKEKDFSEISISEITNASRVSRNSFYRNYSDKEDIIRKYVRCLLQGWKLRSEKSSPITTEHMYGSLFAHLKKNSDFYLLLKKRNLFHLFLSGFLDVFGAKPEQDNLAGYLTSFVAYGTYGWIEEWIVRGMQESAEEMTALLLRRV